MSALKYELLKVGTDAEVFLVSNKTKKPHPVIGLLGGTKHDPLPISELGKGFFIQEDNVMPEFNIPASVTADEFVTNIGRVRSWLEGQMSVKGYSLAIVPSMIFTTKQLDHPQAQEVGCEPDFNVWTQSVNESPKMRPEMKTMRTAAAHIHVSFNVNGKPPKDVYQREAVVKALDLTIGLPSVVLDTDKRRRVLYGKAGAFRMKDYGIEHRVASNFWIRTPELQRWAFEGVQLAIELVNRTGGKWLRDYCNAYRDQIQEAINTGNVVSASNWLHELQLTNRLNVSAAA